MYNVSVGIATHVAVSNSIPRRGGGTPTPPNEPHKRDGGDFTEKLNSVLFFVICAWAAVMSAFVIYSVRPDETILALIIGGLTFMCSLLFYPIIELGD